jgi:S-disulfanyl-L-cysteine oxidoreductase SoxD
MFRFLETGLTTLLLSCLFLNANAQTKFPGLGRIATPKEVQAWDIDVRPDFKGLPPGSGSVAKGQDIWEAKCASCHGVFGESNQVFSPLVGGTTQNDIHTGKVARLLDDSYPGRTTLMKLPTLATLWDYINRAMPWNQPKSLTTDEVYAVTAFMLNLGGIVPDNFVLSNSNMVATQKLLPNRDGMSTAHAMWPGKLKGASVKVDYQGSACMKDCRPEAKIASLLPDFARDAHGNLADQNRLIGAQKGAVTLRASATEDTSLPTSLAPAGLASPPSKLSSAPPSQEILGLLNQHSCLACHGMDSKLVGPSFQEVRKKYSSRADVATHLATRIKSGGSGVWGAIPMPPQSLSEDEAKAIAQWLGQ